MYNSKNCEANIKYMNMKSAKGKENCTDKINKNCLEKSNQTLNFKSKTTANHLTKQKIKRKNYSPESLQYAIEALKNGASLRKAANAFGVPVVTLHRRKNNPNITNSRRIPTNVFTEAEEANIVNWITYRAERGYPVTKPDLLDGIKNYVELMKKRTPFVENRPGRHWYEAFKRRHPELTIRTDQHLFLTRAAVTREDVMEWFAQIGNYLSTKGLMNISPDRVFNCDETSMLLCPNSEKVLTTRDVKAAYKVSDDRKESLTILFTYSAAGTRVPPMLTFAHAGKVPKAIIENTPKGWGIGVSENGCMTAETFYEYITNVFYPWLLKKKTEFPVILYLDNHSSHVNIPLAQFCREKQIEIIALHPNSTHVMQPLAYIYTIHIPIDIAYFHPFKETCKRTVPERENTTSIVQLKKENFPKVLQMALDSMKDEKTIIVNGFKAAGLVPFDSNAIDYDVLQKRKYILKTTETEDKTQIPDKPIENEEQFVQLFEKNIPVELLQAFQEALENGVWNGDVEKKGLFEYWLQIKKKSLSIAQIS